MIDLLASLDFVVSGGKTIAVAVPTFRPDVTREIDLIEEIARIAGYATIPVRRKAAGRVPTPANSLVQFESRLREVLVGAGLFEVVTNSLVDPRRLPSEEAARAIKLKNPLSEELSVMRTSLCGPLLQVIAHNYNRQVPTIQIFEIGRVFQRIDGTCNERRAAAIMMAGDAPVTRWESDARPVDFFDLKGVLTTMCRSWRLSPVLRVAENPALNPRASFELCAGETTVGAAGLVDDEYARRYGVKIPVWTAFLEFDKLERAARSMAIYRPVPRFPKAERDCAVVVPLAINSGELVDTIREAAPQIIEQIDIFDIYTGTPIPPGKKSVAISIAYRALDNTLTDMQVNDIHGKIIELLKKKFKAELRE